MAAWKPESEREKGTQRGKRERGHRVRRGTTIAIMPGHARSSLSHRVGSIALYGASLASCRCVIQARRGERVFTKLRPVEERGLPSLHKTRRGASVGLSTTSKYVVVPLERLDSPGILRGRLPCASLSAPRPPSFPFFVAL